MEDDHVGSLNPRRALTRSSLNTDLAIDVFSAKPGSSTMRARCRRVASMLQLRFSEWIEAAMRRDDSPIERRTVCELDPRNGTSRLAKISIRSLFHAIHTAAIDQEALLCPALHRVRE